MNPDPTYIYGYGRTKHIVRTLALKELGRAGWGLCGAPGGFPYDEPERPVCKRCLKMASAIHLEDVR